MRKTVGGNGAIARPESSATAVVHHDELIGAGLSGIGPIPETGNWEKRTDPEEPPGDLMQQLKEFKATATEERKKGVKGPRAGRFPFCVFVFVFVLINA